nr:uncharacterized protein LOC111505204 isoform X1 [Leptinotarsa decemlineata]
MDSDRESINSRTESEEDDVGCYFLQPSSTPYNIAEKIQEANIVLFTTNPTLSNQKTSRVRFREELISYEPDMTDDDVNSIESDHIEITSDSQSTVEFKTTINGDLNIFDIEEVDEVEEIVEEVNSEIDFNVEKVQESSEFIKEKDGERNMTNNTINITSNMYNSIKKSGKQKQQNQRYSNIHKVHCRDHCIERLDFDLSMSIKKLEIHEKVILPPLQLLQRKCCDEVKQKVYRNLPSYNGLRSEYGLTYRQLQKREREKEISKLKEQTRRKLIEEYRDRKIQQNEEVFSQWLKEISRRRTEKHSAQKLKIKQSITPNVISLPNKQQGKVRARPKTANEFVPKTQVKKPRRPHTTSSCVFIEVPQRLLERGINIGDLIITNSKFFTKKLHLLAVS